MQQVSQDLEEETAEEASKYGKLKKLDPRSCKWVRYGFAAPECFCLQGASSKSCLANPTTRWRAKNELNMYAA